MAIFDINTTFVPTPETRANRIVQFIQDSIEVLRRIQQEAINLVWVLPQGMTTQQVFDALDALTPETSLELIELNQQFSQFLETFKPGSSSSLPPGCSVIINSDNTITAITP